MKNKYLVLSFVLCVGLWFFLFARSLFIKGGLGHYKILLSRSAEGKRSYVAGDSLYKFLTFCNNNIPEGASYRLIGPDKESIEKRRAVYYLYPRQERSDPDFILVYNDPAIKAVTVKGYGLFISLNDNEYIMKKKGLR